MGRHVVASRDILPGEVLFTEAPLVSCQLDDHVEAVCEVTIITVIISVIIMIISPAGLPPLHRGAHPLPHLQRCQLLQPGVQDPRAADLPQVGPAYLV